VEDRVTEDDVIRKRMAEEELITERVDEIGGKWTKVYFGGGGHFKHWLTQFLEIWGEDNIYVEETDSRGFRCYEESGEKMYRIWVKQRKS
jgi:hypothetical protein